MEKYLSLRLLETGVPAVVTSHNQRPTLDDARSRVKVSCAAQEPFEEVQVCVPELPLFC